jgi:Asp-tRNA(Asn)/Glu-tRNA(Gln) amidotransferase A subunit family amidase
MLIEGTKVSAIEYLQAMHITKEIRKEFLLLLQHKVDAIIIPTTVIPAPKLDENSVFINKDFLMDIREALLGNAVIFNGIGLPAISILFDFTREKGLPIGCK